MSNIKVIDIQNEEEQTIQNEEAKEEVKEEVTEITNEEVTETTTQNEATNTHILDIDKEVSETKIEEKPNQRVKMQDKMVTCPKCKKYLKIKSYRYGHEQKCTGLKSSRNIIIKRKYFLLIIIFVLWFHWMVQPDTLAQNLLS